MLAETRKARSMEVQTQANPFEHLPVPMFDALLLVRFPSTLETGLLDDCFETLGGGRRSIQHLTRRQLVSRQDDVSFSNLVGVQSHSA